MTTTKVYLARLAGVAVFDPHGDQVGRVRDAVVALRIGSAPPRVRGLVVEIAQRKRIFVPVGRMTSLESDAVILTTGTLSLKRFEQRPGETLVLGELLDRPGTLGEDRTRVVVIDAAMEQSRTRDWLITRLAVRDDAGNRFARRRGHIRQVDWDQVGGLSLRAADQGAENLLAVYESMRPADLAGALRDLSPVRRNEVAAALDDERLASVLVELPEDEQIAILGKLTGERAADVLEEMDPDDAADLLGDLPQAERERLLELMEPDESAPLRRLLHYADDSAGGLMNPEPVILSPDATVAEALARIREPSLSPALAAQVYVSRPPLQTPTGRYLGLVHVQRLLREPPSALVSGILDDDIDALRTDATLRQVTSLLAAYNLVAVPIVDESGRLLGAISVDDVLDNLLPTDWRENRDD